MLKSQFFIRKRILYLRLKGELDEESIELVRTRVTNLINNYKILFLVINCQELTFMDSTGIGFILGRYKELRRVGGKVVLCEANELVYRIISISGLNRIITYKRTEEEANEYLEGYSGKICAL